MTRRTKKNGNPDRRRRRRFWRLLHWLVVVAAWGAFALAVIGVYLSLGLPAVSEFRPPALEPSVVVLARDGSTIATYGDVSGEWLDYEELPPVLVDAVIATEDRRFWRHHGVDLRGVARAMWNNLKAGQIVEGGSTITQQLAKNLFLSPERTWKRKIQELMLALWLEIKLDKEEILALYLNRMYLGARSYGVDAAARTYFGHGARTLALGEAALLAGLLKAPSALSPLRDYDMAVRRSHEVLSNMVEAGVLTEEAARHARDHPPDTLRPGPGTDSRYFADWVVDSLPADVRAAGVPLIVHSTLDPTAQAVAERALQRRLSTEGADRRISQGAVVVMSADGAVRAMVGGRSYADSQFNRAVQAHRQPGSAFKLFVYLAALDAGLGPDSRMRDSPIVLDGWQPENYDDAYRGMITLREAFADSVNTVAVKVAERVDRRRVIDVAHRLGIQSRITPHPSVALGTSELTLLEMTTAYAVIAGGGYAVRPYGIIEVRSSRGELMYRPNFDLPERIVSPRATEIMRDMLAHAVSDGTGRAARFARPAAGKTGTSQDFRDAWFIGFSGDYVAGVWLGNDDGTPMVRVTGGSVPARLWRDVMVGLYQGMTVEPVGRPMRRPAPEAREPDSEEGGLFDRLRESVGELGDGR
ncbi:MAG: PBP1A family penicillin-binding protein [Alphaproteobacteria bacterium]|nr:MAG: PBP1A family penicillin-binding protein [Alphaproteobacteria bacterium]